MYTIESLFGNKILKQLKRPGKYEKWKVKRQFQFMHCTTDSRSLMKERRTLEFSHIPVDLQRWSLKLRMKPSKSIHQPVTRRLRAVVDIPQTAVVWHLPTLGKVDKRCQEVIEKKGEGYNSLRSPSQQSIHRRRPLLRSILSNVRGVREKISSVNRRIGILLQQDNAKLHIATQVQEKILKFVATELLPHPAYSPDLAPID